MKFKWNAKARGRLLQTGRHANRLWDKYGRFCWWTEQQRRHLKTLLTRPCEHLQVALVAADRASDGKGGATCCVCGEYLGTVEEYYARTRPRP